MTFSNETSQQPLKLAAGADISEIYRKNHESPPIIIGNGLWTEIHNDVNFFHANRIEIKKHLPTIQKHLDEYTVNSNRREKILLDLVSALQPIIEQNQELLPLILCCEHGVTNRDNLRPREVIIEYRSLQQWAVSIYEPKKLTILGSERTCLDFVKTVTSEDSNQILANTGNRKVLTFHDFIPLMICLILIVINHYAEIKNGK